MIAYLNSLVIDKYFGMLLSLLWVCENQNFALYEFYIVES
jgi:hypothetical protein